MSPCEDMAAQYLAHILRTRYPNLEDLNPTELCGAWKDDDPLYPILYLTGIRSLAVTTGQFKIIDEVDTLLNILTTRIR